jgi:hypothetical protein
LKERKEKNRERERKESGYVYSSVLSQYRHQSTGCTTGVQFPTGAMMRYFPFATASQPALGPAEPPVQWVPGVLSPAVKRPGREADPSLLPTVWSSIFTSQYAFKVWCLMLQCSVVVLEGEIQPSL